jgi:hypothetical protein
MTAPAPVPTPGRRNPRRYGRASLRTGRLETIVAIMVGVALLGALAALLLPSPASTIALVAVVAGGVALVLYDGRRAPS